MHLIIETVTEDQELVFKLMAKTMNLVCKSEDEMEDHYLGLMMQKTPLKKLTTVEATDFEAFLRTT